MGVGAQWLNDLGGNAHNCCSVAAGWLHTGTLDREQSSFLSGKYRIPARSSTYGTVLLVLALGVRNRLTVGAGRLKKASSTRLGRYPLFLVMLNDVVW